MGYGLNVEFDLKFEIEKIIKRKDDAYTVVEIKALRFPDDFKYTKFKTMKLRGHFPVIFVGDVFNARVILRENHKFGYYLNIVSDLVYELPHTKKAIVKFLKKRVSNIKKAEAEELVNIGGRRTISKLINTPEIFYDKCSITARRLKNIKDKIYGDAFFEDLMLFMQTMKIGAMTANYIYQTFGITSITKIKSNPYTICMIPEIKFSEVDHIAESLGIAFNDIRRIKSGILEYLQNKENQNGDICVVKEELFNCLSDFLKKYGGFSEANVVEINQNSIKEAYDVLISKEKVIEEKTRDNIEVIYLKELYEAETRIIDNVRLILSTPNILVPDSKVEEYLNRHPENDRLQNQAIKEVFKSRCSILTGGPGVGKTYTVNQIVKCLKECKKDATIRLLAPTGRASSKLSEVTGLPSSTIHRALHIRPGNENKDEKNKTILNEDLVICDESSMNDVIVFSKLLNGISAETTLLIVGDDNQLSPVGPGLVLRDMIDSKTIPVTCLNKIFRQAEESQIVMNSHKLKNGLTTKDKNGISFDSKKGDFYFIQRNTISTIADTIIEMTLRTIKTKGIPISDILLLSPIKDDYIGVHNLNRELQLRLNPASPRKQEFEIDGLLTIREGDKVINTKNDEDMGVNNGDIGRVINIDSSLDSGEPNITVEFNNGHIAIYDTETIKNLELAYCITVHKAQGTEADVVIMPISPSHIFNLNKRLVYTAWTRAKKMVICVGDINTLDEIVKKDELPRKSRLLERLQDIKAECIIK